MGNSKRFTAKDIERSACGTLNKEVVAEVKNKTPKFRYFIGIDTGVNTGMAVWDSVLNCFVFVESMAIHTAMERVKALVSATNLQGVFIRVEDARKWTHGTDAIRAQGAGSVKRDAKIWDDFLSELGAYYEMVRPNKFFTKWDAVKFRQLTGYDKTTNGHGRDAATLVWQYKQASLKLKQ